MAVIQADPAVGTRYDTLPPVAPEAFQCHAMVFSVAPRRLMHMRYIRRQCPWKVAETCRLTSAIMHFRSYADDYY